jgi:Uma2 family endonuclease
MAIAQERMTLEEFLELPEEKPALEFEDGVVTQKVAPQGQHSLLEPGFAGAINQFAMPKKLAAAFTELRTTFAGASLVPDIAVYRWERIPRDPDGRVANKFLDQPDIAIEIVSPSQSVTSLIRRCPRYLERGVPISLILDPDDESVILLKGGLARVLHGDDRIDLSELLPEFELTVRQVFSILRLD